MFFRKYEKTSTHLVKNKITNMLEGEILSNWTLSSVFTPPPYKRRLAQQPQNREGLEKSVYEAFLGKIRLSS